MDNSDVVLKWIDRMVKKCGGTVYDIEGKKYDWGQALARECYGADWIKFVPDEPTSEDVKRAKRWEEGEWPFWVDKIRIIQRNIFKGTF